MSRPGPRRSGPAAPTAAGQRRSPAARPAAPGSAVRRGAAPLVGAVLVGAVLVGCASRPADGAAGRHAETAGQPAVAAGCPATTAAGGAATATGLPDLTLPCLGAGGPVPLRALSGTPTVLNLWASWCAPCRVELPAFQQLYAKAGGRLRVLGVVSEDAPANARSFAGAAGVRFGNVVDDTGRLRRALGRSALPATVLVAADGRVAKVYSGRPLAFDDLRRLVRDALGVVIGS